MTDSPSSILARIGAYVPRTVLQRRIEYPGTPRVYGGLGPGAVLFADISGFTALSERLSRRGKAGAEEVTAVLNRCFVSLLETLFDDGGDLIKFGGDALTALFVGDRPQAAVAVRAALRMQRAMQQFGQVQTSAGTARLAMSVGVNWGQVYLAEVGSRRRLEVVLSGREVNRTAVAEGSAAAGEVVVTEATFGLVADCLRGQRLENGCYRIVDPGPAEAVSSPPPAIDIAALQRAGGLELLKPYLVHGLYQKLTTRASDIEGEHRRVAVLFVNCWGFDYEEDQQATQKLNAYVLRVMASVYRYGGVLNKIDMYTRGDKLMVLFGAPVAHENDEERAVCCALDIRRECQGLGFDFHHCFGINAGDVYAGIVGSDRRKEYTVMGDAVNLAARLMGQAAAGQVLVSQAVAEKVRPLFELVHLGKRSFKGKEAAMPVYEAVAGRPGRALRQTAPLIGRQPQKAALEAVAQKAMGGRGQAVELVGEAGIGKSCLAAEMATCCRDRGMKVLTAECPFYGAGSTVPYLPWIELLKKLLDAGDGPWALGGLPAAERQALETLLGAGAQTGDAADPDPAERKERIFAAIAALVRQEAQKGALAVFFEDVHWMDDLSWDLLDTLVRGMAELPLLVVVIRRPAPGPSAWQDLPYASCVRLTELSPAEARQLIAARLQMDEPSPQLYHSILSRSQGNPFFIEEVIHAITEGSRPTAAAATAPIEVPDTIQRVINSRIDHLDEEDKSLIKVAAVVGPQFSAAFLQGIYPYAIDGSQLHKRLERLEGLDFIVAQDQEYVFRHVLIQETAYERLPFVQRRQLHLQAARYIEASFPQRLEEQYERLAHHYSRTDADDKAVDYLTKAGLKAKGFYANQAAVDYLAVARRLLEKRPEAPAYWDRCYTCDFAAGDIYRLTGRNREALSSYESALGAARQTGERIGQARAYQALGRLKDRLGDFAEARHCLSEALGLAAGHDRVLEATLFVDMGNNCTRMGRLAEALDYFGRSLPLWRQLDDRQRVAVCELNMGSVYRLMGDLPRAVTLLEQAHTVFKKADDKEREVTVLVNLADLHMDQGDYPAAAAACAGALGICREAGDRDAELDILARLGEIEQLQGAYAEALEQYQRVLEQARQLEHEAMEAVALNNIGQLYWDLGEYRQAYESSREALRLIRAKMLREKDLEAGALHTLGLAAGSLGDGQRAFACLQEAERIAAETGNGDVQAHTLINIGRRLLSLGKGQEAREKIDQGLSVARQAGFGELEVYGLLSLAIAHMVLGDSALDDTALGDTALDGIDQSARARAAALVAEAETLNRDLGDRGTDIQLAKLRAELAQVAGQAAVAIDHYEEALSLTRALKTKKEEGWLLLGLAKVLYADSQAGAAMERFAAAVPLAVDQEDRPLQDKLLAVLLRFEHDALERAARGEAEAEAHCARIGAWVEQLRRTTAFAVDLEERRGGV